MRNNKHCRHLAIVFHRNYYLWLAIYRWWHACRFSKLLFAIYCADIGNKGSLIFYKWANIYQKPSISIWKILNGKDLDRMIVNMNLLLSLCANGVQVIWFCFVCRPPFGYVSLINCLTFIFAAFLELFVNVLPEGSFELSILTSIC